MGDFGDFEEIKEEGQVQEQEQQTSSRVKSPQKGEFMGVIVQRLGGNRMEVRCSDGKTRNCRIPGRFKRSFWLRPNDVIIVKPWDGDDEKADIIFHYPKNAAAQLRKSGALDNMTSDF